MPFLKPSADAAGDRFVARLQALIWILIYGGLLTLVLGLSVLSRSDTLGWSLVAGGGVVAAVGFGLIYVRSRITTRA